VDVLVNNAGVEVSGALDGLTAQDVDRMLRVNLHAPIELARQALPGLIARGAGHVTNVSSLAGVVAFPGMSAYGASKAGLAHFTAILREDLARTGVGTTLVELGPVTTDMLDGAMSYEPTKASFQRAYDWRLIVDVPRGTVATAVVRGVERGTTNVRLPFARRRSRR
jgi:short-subunit dehydrogenase